MLADGSVTIKKLADGIITESKLMAQSITTGKVKDGAITPDKFSALFPVVGVTGQITVAGGSDRVIGGTVTLSIPTPFEIDGFAAAYVGKTSAYTVTGADYTVDGTANDFTVTLPSATITTGQVYNIKNSASAASTVTVVPSGAQTIEGETQQFLYQGNCMTVQSTGAAWIII